MYKAIMT